MTETIKAVFVNAAARTIEDVVIDRGLKSMYDLIGCRLVDLVHVGDGDDLFVDDEGLLTMEPTSPMFRIGDCTLAGSGVIIGGNDETGESCNVNHDAAHYRKLITFTNAWADASSRTLRKALNDESEF
jgi:hypothetical protein